MKFVPVFVGGLLSLPSFAASPASWYCEVSCNYLLATQGACLKANALLRDQADSPVTVLNALAVTCDTYAKTGRCANHGELHAIDAHGGSSDDPATIGNSCKKF